MSTKLENELSDLLSVKMLGHPYDSNSTHRERFVIDHLVEQFAYWCMGSMPTSRLRAIFAEQDLNGFDLDAWMQSKADDEELDLEPEIPE